jgi:hypothetical protein
MIIGAELCMQTVCHETSLIILNGKIIFVKLRSGNEINFSFMCQDPILFAVKAFFFRVWKGNVTNWSIHNIHIYIYIRNSVAAVPILHKSVRMKYTKYS